MYQVYRGICATFHVGSEDFVELVLPTCACVPRIQLRSQAFIPTICPDYLPCLWEPVGYYNTKESAEKTSGTQQVPSAWDLRKTSEKNLPLSLVCSSSVCWHGLSFERLIALCSQDWNNQVRQASRYALVTFHTVAMFKSESRLSTQGCSLCPFPCRSILPLHQLCSHGTGFRLWLSSWNEREKAGGNWISLWQQTMYMWRYWLRWRQIHWIHPGEGK